MRKIVLTGLLLVSTAAICLAQDCKVLMPSLSQTYSGDCVKGKAEGKGKAVGQDTYEGDFVSGWPEGKGTYTWKEGSYFTGLWKKGLRDGQGEMHFKTQSGGDSVLVGFWKKDKYMGRYEKPYRIVSQSTKVSNVRVSSVVDSKDKTITLNVSNTSGGTANVATGSSLDNAVNAKLKIDDIDVASGIFTARTNNDNSARSSQTILRGIEFPFKAKFRIGDHSVEIEFLEPASYSVDINILQ